MEIDTLNRKVNAADLPLEKLASSSRVPQKEKVAEVSRQFEALLLRQILSQAQKPLCRSTASPGSATTNAIYQDMATQQLADRISRGGTFGFAKILERQLVLPGSEQPPETAGSKL
jgi:Rod binding domain-containing protein